MGIKEEIEDLDVRITRRKGILRKRWLIDLMLAIFFLMIFALGFFISWDLLLNIPELQNSLMIICIGIGLGFAIVLSIPFNIFIKKLPLIVTKIKNKIKIRKANCG
jgi:hypothetical protein